MKKIEINNQTFIIPEKWEDLTFEKYCEVFYALEDNPDNLDSINTKNEIKIFSRLIGITESEILNAPIDFYNRLRDLFKWVYVRESFFFSDADNELVIDGVKYYIPSYDEITLRQHIDIDVVTQGSESEDKFINLLAVILIPEGGKYTGDEKVEKALMDKLKKLPCTDCFRLLGFFLLKGKLSTSLLHLSTLMEEEVNQLHQATANS